MQVAKYKYGKHCHLCACLTKDPIVRSYFRFLKYLTSLLLSFSILSFIAVNFLRAYVIVCSCSEQLQECEWEVCRVCREKYGFPSIFFGKSLVMDGLGVVSGTPRPSQVLPPVPGCVLLLQPVSIPAPECLSVWQKEPPFAF